MSPTLPLIEEAIDVPMMDVKNVAKIIFSYIEYDEVKGPQFDIFMELYEPCYSEDDGERLKKDKVIWKVFINENKPIIVSRVQERVRAEYGITINGIHYIYWFLYPVLERWFYDAVMNIRGYSYRGRSTENYFMFGMHYRNNIYQTSTEFKIYTKEDDWLRKFIEAKRKPMKKQIVKLMSEKVLEPFVDFYCEKINNL
jgi:hypothetical protein